MPISLNGQTYYRTAEVCRMTGISRNTLFDIAKSGFFHEPEKRDWRGWRLFTGSQVNQFMIKTRTVTEIISNNKTDQLIKKEIINMENNTSTISRWAYEIKGRQRQCVFLADGSQYDVKLLRGVLESDGWQTSLVGKAYSADNVKADAPDLVVIDSMLTDVDPLKICRDIRLQSRVPVLVFGQTPDKETLVACLEAGADDFITMPLNPAELLARVRALVRFCRVTGN